MGTSQGIHKEEFCLVCFYVRSLSQWQTINLIILFAEIARVYDLLCVFIALH